jgi:hypothetical protein
MRIVDVTGNITYTAQFAAVPNVDALLAQIAQLEADTAACGAAYRNLLVLVNSLEAQLAIANNTIINLNTQIIDLEAERDYWKEKYEDCMTDVDSLLNLISALQAQIEELEAQIIVLELERDYWKQLYEECCIDPVSPFEIPSLKIYPNPAKDMVTVELSENTVGTLALFDLNGKIVKRQSVNGNIATIDIGSLSAGTYVLRLVQDGVASVGVKIMKE